MTSTSFNVGVDAEAKNSSRVLRPPGGGHTDIFGLKEPIAPEVRKEDNRRNASSILEGTNTEIPSVNKCEKKPTPNPVQEKNDTAAKVEAQTTQGRTRVPPGGFSSGLW